MTEGVSEDNVPTKRSRGRPKKSEIAKAGKTGKVGRPKGTAAIINDYRDRMLASPKSRAVLESIFNNKISSPVLFLFRAAAAALVVVFIFSVILHERLRCDEKRTSHRLAR